MKKNNPFYHYLAKYQKALINAAKQIEKLENEVDQLMLRKELVDNDSVVPLEFVRKIA